MRSTRISSLDGLRGIAILMVLADHMQRDLWQDSWRSWTATGQHGVTFFFVLSGYLITSHLLVQPHLGRFYLRRFFRLMPVAWTYIAFIGLVAFAAKHPLPKIEIASSLLFFRNYAGMGSPVLRHFWSLSVEEQFYLAWPVVLLALGVRRARWLVAAVAVIVAAWRLSFWHFYDDLPTAFHTEVRADALCIGCLLALLLESDVHHAGILRWSRRLTWPALAVFSYAVARFQWLPPLFEDVAIAVLLAAALSPETVLTRVLSFSPLAWLGRISYSIYVWHEVFRGVAVHAGWFAPLVLLLPGVLSYSFIENPCIQFGKSLVNRLAVHASRRSNPPSSRTAGAVDY